MRLGWRRPMILGFLSVGLLIAGVGGWVTQTEIDGAVVAPGTVAVRGRPQTVQHLDGGIVAEIYVENGDAVDQGTPLLRLNDTTIVANLEIYRNRLRDAITREARLTAELREADAIAPDDLRDLDLDLGDLSRAMSEQENLLRARRDMRIGQMEGQSERIEQFRNQINGFQALIAARRKQVELVDEELVSARKLVEQGLAPQARLNALLREQSDLEGQIAEYSAEIARIRSAIGEIRITQLQIGREHQESVLAERSEVAQTIDELTQQIRATEAQLGRITVRAPSDGLVHEMAISTLGAVIPPGAEIAQIIPVSRGVEVEVSVNPGEIDQIYQGQTARLRFPAFNQRTTPQIEAAVSLVSPSSIRDEATGASFYRVGIEIPADQRALLGDVQLTPGMPVEAFLITDGRSVAEYLARPITDYFARALRER